ncbi:MAG: COX15/CtaA family protein [Thermoanaerobaculia bacterium]
MRLARFAWFVLGLNLAVILWGAIVRATGSGAGCGAHWPLCNGDVVPRAPRLETLIEYSHRLSSGAALLAGVALLVSAFRARPAGDPVRRGAVWALLLLLGEAAVGAGLVLFRLVADDASVARALWMGVHLGNTLALLAALTLAALWAGGLPAPRLAGRGRTLAEAGLASALLVATAMSGAVAALGDTLFPAGDLAAALRQDLSTGSHFLLRLRVLHPLLAVATGVLLLWLAPRWRRADRRAGVRRWALALSALVFLQMLAGTANMALLAPVGMQIVHLLLANAVWIAFVGLVAATLAARAESNLEASTSRPAPAALDAALS